MDVLSEVFNIPKMICASATTQEEERRCERKGSSVKERENTRESEGIGGCWQGETGRQAERAGRERERKRARGWMGGRGRGSELEGSNRTSKLNVEIRVECLAR